jgi:hypothetical protein
MRSTGLELLERIENKWLEMLVQKLLATGEECIAQLVEHWAFNLMVVGSNPTTLI